MFNCGMLAIELPREDIASIFALGADVTIKVDMEHNLISAENPQGKSLSMTFSMNEFDRDLVRAGGWLAYADKKY
jgi:3-isopropylmalate/(R)-2-methylmalate dehydratase small subunit